MAEKIPPVFRKDARPVLQNDQPWEGPITNVNSGLLYEDGRWRLWYTSGAIGTDQHGVMRVLYAESDDGRNWRKPILEGAAVTNTNIVLPRMNPEHRAYLPSVHREGEKIIAFTWCDTGEFNALFRFVSTDGLRFDAEPYRPLINSSWASQEAVALAGEGRTSNDAFSVMQNADGSYSYYAACLQPNRDERTVFANDNLSAFRRVICRADSKDGIEWTPTKVIIEPEYSRDAFETQFYGMHVFRYQNYYLGLLFTYYLERQIIWPEWAWSQDGWNWQRTYAPCLQLGADGSFDSRMILFGDTQIVGEELVWLYAGANWKHNDFARPDVSTRVGYASLPLYELDAWVSSLNNDID